VRPSSAWLQPGCAPWWAGPSKSVCRGATPIHETGLARNIVEIVEQAAAANGLKRVSRVLLEIGVLAGVEAGQLEFAFRLTAEGTVAEGAALEIQRIPLLLHCPACETEYVGDEEDMRCPGCLGERFELLTGRELLVQSIFGE